MSIGPNRWTRRRRLLYSGIVLAALALLVWMLPRKEKGRVTHSFVAYTNSPEGITVIREVEEPVPFPYSGFPYHSVTRGQMTLETWRLDAIMEVRNGTSDPIELQPGLLTGLDSNLPIYLSNLGSGNVLLKPGQSTNLVISFVPLEPWYAEISYQRRSFLDRQFSRMRYSGKAPLQFLSRINSKWSEVVSVRTGWITNEPKLWPPPRHHEQPNTSVKTSTPKIVPSEPLRPSVPEPPVATGPIADAADATRRAVRAANELAQKQGFDRPFRVGNKPAV